MLNLLIKKKKVHCTAYLYKALDVCTFFFHLFIIKLRKLSFLKLKTDVFNSDTTTLAFLDAFSEIMTNHVQLTQNS
jgi:hypothetical protein